MRNVQQHDQRYTQSRKSKYLRQDQTMSSVRRNSGQYANNDKREFGSGTSFQYYEVVLSRRNCHVELATDFMIPTSVMQQYDRIHPWCVSFSTNQQEDRGILCPMAG
jgi:hypothetical protein